jgi:outer membrane protein assembly factor BamA
MNGIRAGSIAVLMTHLVMVVTFAGNDSGSTVVVDRIEVRGNRVTRENVILRELSFSKGDTLTESGLREACIRSRDNLMNTGLFNFADVIPILFEERASITIELTERWYIWPVPIFEQADRNLPAWLKDPDWGRINYGMVVNWNNFRGRKELLELKVRMGYKPQLYAGYLKPNLGKKQQHGVGFSVTHFRQHEAAVLTRDNKPVFYRNGSNFLYETLSPSIGYVYRPGLYFTQSVSVAWTKLRYNSDSLHYEFLGTPPGTGPQWFTLLLKSEFDNRDYKAYPLKGKLLAVSVLQRGFVKKPETVNPKTYVIVNGALHTMPLPRFYLTQAAKLRFTEDSSQPQIFREALGFNTNLRGFEYYVIDGNSYGIIINNLKYNLIKERVKELPAIPWTQFGKINYAAYLNCFFDMAYVEGRYYNLQGNTLTNTFLWSTGLGFDFVTYYDQVYRLEFTLNSLGETGVFFHMETPFARW